MGIVIQIVVIVIIVMVIRAVLRINLRVKLLRSIDGNLEKLVEIGKKEPVDVKPKQISCPGCSANFRISPEAAGKKVRCAKCLHLFVVKF